MKKIVSLLGVAIAIGFSSCNDINSFVMEEHQGAFILNKGTDKSSVSHYSYEREAVTNNYFQARSIGMNAGAHTIATRKGTDYPKGKAFIVYPTANEIAMVNLEGYTAEGTIEGYTKPTDILLANEDVAFISATGADGKGMVYEYNLKSKKQLNAFEVAKDPLKMIASGKHLYCASKGDGTGAKVIAIDMTNGVKVDTIALPYDNPIDMVVDIDRNVWVYCAGSVNGLIKITKYEMITLDANLDSERDTLIFSNRPEEFLLGDHLNDSANPLSISNDGRLLYYVYGSLCSNTVYAEGNVSKESIVAGDYQKEAFSGIDYDSRTNRIMALTSSGKLVILKDKGEVWNDDEVYDVGVNPIMSAFNY